MSSASGNTQEEASDSESGRENEQLSNRELTAIIEQQELEIAALREQLHAICSANAPASPEDVAPCGSSLHALQRGLTTVDDVRAVGTLCKQLVGVQWERLQEVFFKQVQVARDALPERVLQWEDSVAEDWYKDAWYLLYVQDMGVEEGKEEGDFDSLRAMLPYLKRQGFRNLCVLPHYESPMADGGYDVSRYEPRASLGGEEAFKRFMDDAFEQGIRVCTDGIYNHTSTEHEWFQRAVHGEEKYINYYVQRNGREKIGERDSDGDIICKYRDPDGCISERVVVFPDVDRTHGLWVEINGKSYHFYRSFYPFQVDLNLQNVDVLEEIVCMLGRELCSGVVAKRMDAALHWIKKGGTNAEGLEETHTLMALFKAFVKHVNARAILLPEVVRDCRTVARYGGHATTWNGVQCSSEGDLLTAFEMQAALRESTYLRTVAPFWRATFEASATRTGGGEWLNMLEHHDETYMGFYPREVRRWMGEYIRSAGGTLFKNGMSAAARLADCLQHERARVRGALVALYLAVGTPMVYQGSELWRTRSAWPFARAQARRLHARLQQLGVYVCERACFDARWLQRGPLPRAAFELDDDDDDDGVEEQQRVSETVRRLNEARATMHALRGGEVRAVDSAHADVLAVGRGAAGRRALLGVVSMCTCERELRVPARQLRALWRGAWPPPAHALLDVLSSQRVRVQCGADALVRWRVRPFDAQLLRLPDAAADGAFDSNFEL